MHTIIGPLDGWKLFADELHLRIAPPRWSFAVTKNGWFDAPSVGLRLSLKEMPIIVDKAIRIDTPVEPDGIVTVHANSRTDGALDEVRLTVEFASKLGVVARLIPPLDPTPEFKTITGPPREMIFGDFRRYRPGLRVDNRGVTFRNGGADWTIEGRFDLIDGHGQSCGSDVCAFNCDTGEVTWHVLDAAGLPKLTPDRSRIETASALRPLPFTVQADGIKVAPHESPKAYLNKLGERRRAEWLHPTDNTPRDHAREKVGPFAGCHAFAINMKKGDRCGRCKDCKDYAATGVVITIDCDPEKVAAEISEGVNKMLRENRYKPVLLSNEIVISKAEMVRVAGTPQAVVTDLRLEGVNLVASMYVPPGIAIIDPKRFLTEANLKATEKIDRGVEVSMDFRVPELDHVVDNTPLKDRPNYANGVVILDEVDPAAVSEAMFPRVQPPTVHATLDHDKIAAALGASDRITVAEAEKLAAEGKTWDGFDVSPMVRGLKAIQANEAIDKAQREAFKNGLIPGAKPRKPVEVRIREDMTLHGFNALPDSTKVYCDSDVKFTPDDDDVQPVIVEG